MSGSAAGRDQEIEIKFRTDAAGLARLLDAPLIKTANDLQTENLKATYFDTPGNALRGEGIVLRPGMFFTIEPMINLGKPHVKILSDGWTAVTRDRSLSAQFEHTVGVTETGCEVFTLSPLGLDRPPYGRQ
jgi:hypothetical protein